MAIEHYADDQDHFIFDLVEDDKVTPSKDKLIAFRAAVLECAFSQLSDDPEERNFQRAWQQIGPEGGDCLKGTRKDMRATAQLLRLYSEAAEEGLCEPRKISWEQSVVLLALSERRAQLGAVAGEMVTEIEDFLDATPGLDADAWDTDFQSWFGETDAA